jgi:hypothetical protein
MNRSVLSDQASAARTVSLPSWCYRKLYPVGSEFRLYHETPEERRDLLHRADDHRPAADGQASRFQVCGPSS